MLGFLETPFTAKQLLNYPASISIRLLIYYGAVSSFAYLNEKTKIIKIVLFINFYANRSLTFSLTSTHSSNIIQLGFNKNNTIIKCDF